MLAIPLKILQLEKHASPLEPTPEKRSAWTDAVQQYAFDFIDNLPNNRAFVKKETPDKGILELPIDGQPKPIEQVLSVLKEKVPNDGLNPASGGHLGYIPGGGIYPTALGDYLAAVTNEYAGIFPVPMIILM